MDRSRLYKNRDKSSEELRRRRVDQSVELRRAKKDEQLLKRRNILLLELDETSPLKEKQVETPEHVNYDSLVRDMQSSDDNTRLRAVQLCRKALSRARDPPIDEFIKRNATQILVGTLSSSCDTLAFEACWALTNIASGSSHQTAAVVEGGAVPKLIALLNHPAITVSEQAVWALGNIAGDCTTYRNLVLGAGILQPMLKLLERAWDMKNVVSNITWVLSNLCRNKDPPPPIDVLHAMLPVLNRLLQYDKGKEVLIDAAWALAYASDPANNAACDIISSGCVPHLLGLLSCGMPNLITPALRAVGNLVVGDDQETQAVLDAGLLRYIPPLLVFDKPNIVKETCWVVSNITAGTCEQVQEVINHNIVPCILEVLNQAEFRTQKEACWVISNMINGGTADQCFYLLNNQVIPVMCNLLNCGDSKIVILVLESIRKLLSISKQFGHLESACIEMETCGAVDHLEKLQEHSNEQVYNLAFDIIGRFFNDEDQQSGENTETSGLDAVDDTAVPPSSDQLRFVAPGEGHGQADNFDF